MCFGVFFTLSGKMVRSDNRFSNDEMIRTIEISIF